MTIIELDLEASVVDDEIEMVEDKVNAQEML